MLKLNKKFLTLTVLKIDLFVQVKFYVQTAIRSTGWAMTLKASVMKSQIPFKSVSRFPGAGKPSAAMVAKTWTSIPLNAKIEI